MREFVLQGTDAAAAHVKMHRRFAEENVVSDCFPPAVSPAREPDSSDSTYL